MKILATVRPVADGKGFELIVAERVIGVAKLDCDAQMHANVINEAFDHAMANAEQGAYNDGYNIGYAAAIEYVASGE